MAGLFEVKVNQAMKTISIGELDQLMDIAAGMVNGQELSAIQALTVPLAFRAVDMIAGSVARMPHGVYDEADNEIDDIEPDYMHDLMYRAVASYLVFNAAYCLKEYNQFGANTKWRWLVSPAVSYETNSTTGQITKFFYQQGTQRVTIQDWESNLVYWWRPDLTKEVGIGSGPMNAALGDVRLLDSLTKFASSYFLRGGFPLTLLQYEGVIGDEEQKKTLSWWRSIITGAGNAFKAIMLNKKITPTVIGSNIKDTIAPELYNQAAQNVSIAFGVPLSLLLSNSANYATALDDHVRYYTETVIPLTEMFYEGFNEAYFEPMGYELEANTEEIEVLQQYELQKAQSLSALVGKPIITVDEAREMLGYDVNEALNAPPPPTVINVPTPPMAQEQPAPVDEVPAETPQVKAEREQLRRYAHNRLSDGKPFKFMSGIIPTADIEAVKSCATHEAIDAVQFGARDMGAEVLDALHEAIKLARETHA